MTTKTVDMISNRLTFERMKVGKCYRVNNENWIVKQKHDDARPMITVEVHAREILSDNSND